MVRTINHHTLKPRRLLTFHDTINHHTTDYDVDYWLWMLNRNNGRWDRRRRRREQYRQRCDRETPEQHEARLERDRENITYEDVQLGQLNNDTTYYDREGKDTEKEVTRWSHLPVLVTIVEYHSEYHCKLTYPESRAHNLLRLAPRCC